MNKHDFQVFIDQSILPVKEKDMWREFIKFLPEESLQVIIEFTDGDEKNLTFLTRNITQKRDAFKANDKEAIAAILKEEESLEKKL